MEEDVKKVLEEIRPMLQADGGDVEYVGMDGDVVQVRLTGACGGCRPARIPYRAFEFSTGHQTRVIGLRIWSWRRRSATAGSVSCRRTPTSLSRSI